MEWSKVEDHRLLGIYSSLMAELKRREIVRSSNNPIADYTEKLVARALSLELQDQSCAGFDAVGSDGIRYQIKGRRITPHNKSTQLGALRNLSKRPFDVLAAVIFSEDFSVSYGGLIPIEVVVEKSRFSSHVNSHRFVFRRSVLEDSRVQDITPLLQGR